jgi:hypothetical protein
VQYWLDHVDRLARVDEEWRVFARENGAPELASPSILGRRISSFCGDPTTAEIWSHFLSRARTGAALAVQIRCDAPGWRRLFALHLAGETGGLVRVTTEVVSEERRPRVELLEPERRATAELLVCCSWCKKWRAPSGSWLEVEDLVSELHLMQEAALPGVTHGICEGCGAKLRAGGR